MDRSYRTWVSSSKWLADRIRLKVRSRGPHGIFFLNYVLKVNLFGKIRKKLNIILKIFIFSDVCGPHWTLSRAACLRPGPDLEESNDFTCKQILVLHAASLKRGEESNKFPYCNSLPYFFFHCFYTLKKILKSTKSKNKIWNMQFLTKDMIFFLIFTPWSF